MHTCNGRAVLRATEAAHYLGIGRTKFFALIKSGALPRGIRYDSLRCVVWRVSTLDQFLDRLEQEVADND